MKTITLLALALATAVTASAQSTSQSLAIQVKIPSMLSIDEEPSGINTRTLTVQTNVPRFCVAYLDQQAHPQPTKHAGTTRLAHCFKLKPGRHILTFEDVAPDLGMLAAEKP